MLKVCEPSPPRAHDIDQMGLVGHMHLGGKLAHHLRCGRDFTDGFLLDAQAGDQRRHHHGRHFAGHDLAHQVQHFVMEDFAVFYGALQRFLRGNRHGFLHIFLRCFGQRQLDAKTDKQ